MIEYEVGPLKMDEMIQFHREWRFLAVELQFYLSIFVRKMMFFMIVKYSLEEKCENMSNEEDEKVVK